MNLSPSIIVTYSLFHLEFSMRRILVRTLYSASIAFIALTIPHFSVILALVGGSTIAATNFIFPPLFYLLLSRQRAPSNAFGPPPIYVSQKPSSDFEIEQNSAPTTSTDSIDLRPDLEKENRIHGNWMQIDIPNFVKVMLWEIIILGTVGGISSTYFAILSLANGDSGFTVPCYVDPGVGL